MSAHPDTHSTTSRLPILAIGITIAALGVSGFLDDTGALPHPPWTVAVIAAVVASAFAAVQTLRQLVAGPLEGDS